MNPRSKVASEANDAGALRRLPRPAMSFESVRDRSGALVDFRWVSANEKACTLVGRTEAQLLGKQLLVEMPGNRESGLFEAYSRVAETGTPHSQILRYPFDGFDHWFEVHAEQVGDGFVVLFDDVTDKLRAEAERDAALRQVTQSFACAPFPVVMMRADDLTVASANAVAEAALGEQLGAGVRIEEKLGRIVDRSGLLAALARVREAGGREQLDACRLRADTGSSYFNFVVSAVEGTDLVQLIAADVTAQVVARRRAERADRQKANVLAVLGHELRNPLAAMAAAIEVLRLGKCGDATLAKVAETMQRQVDVSSRLLEDILEASRLERGKVTLRAERLDLRALSVRVVADFVGGRCPVQVVERWPSSEVWVDADPVRLTQVLGNLLSNAVRYTPEGTITVSLAGHDERAVLTVEDTGLGIPARDIPHIFEAFHQVGEHRGHASGGLGLGLSLVAGIVALHGGEVSAHSDGPGEGSRFVVRLPLAKG